MSTPELPRPELLPVTTADGHQTEARLFATTGPARARFVVFPAMGVRARYYDLLGGALAAAGCDALVAELRGQGSSSLRASRRTDWGYETVVAQDWPAVIGAFEARTGGPGAAPLYLLGHSLGGQVSSLYLAAHPEAAAGLVLVASGTNWHRNWGARRGIVLWSQIQLGGVIARGLGYFPGRRLGFGDLQARQEIIDWAATARHGRFVPHGARVDYEAAMAAVRTRVWCYSLEGDTLAPRAATDHLSGKFRAAEVRRRHLTTADVPAACLHHFAWARHPAPVLAQILRDLSLESSQSGTD